MIEIEEDIFAVLRALAEYGQTESDPHRGEYHFSEAEIQAATRIPRRRLQVAVEIACKRGWVNAEGKHTTPFSFNQVSLKSEGLYEFQRRLALIPNQHPSAPAPVNDRSLLQNGIFISYRHKDKKWLEMLQTMLRPLVREQRLTVWDDTLIKAGTKWREEIADALGKAKAAVLLVSPDFLASDFIATHELPHLLKNARSNGLRILWIALRSSFYKETEIGDYQALNEPSRPLSSLRGSAREGQLLQICEQIVAAVETPECIAKTGTVLLSAPLRPEPTKQRSKSPPTRTASPGAGQTSKVPELMAEFVKMTDGKLRRTEEGYEIRLYIKPTPRGARSVRYRLYKDFLEPVRQSTPGEAPTN